MPKCEPDSVLQDQVHRFVSDNHLTVNGAATVLGVNRVTFWRFYDKGEALERTKDRIREALANRSRSASRRVADDAVDAVDGIASGHRTRRLLGSLGDRDLNRIRKACEGVLTLLNAYEAQQSLAREI